MKDPTDWDEFDVESLIHNQVQESLVLDYKRSDALAKTDPKRNELSKDVSAFANSAGGVILYGMIEDKHVPTAIDGGLDPNDISKEWIEQVINAYVQPKIEGLRINQISTKAGRVLYAISIPVATARAPHQARDKRYYKRYNFECVPMEDYEIRDIYRRASTPDLWVDFRFPTGKSTSLEYRTGSTESNAVALAAVIGNRSREPALYAVIEVFLDARFAMLHAGGMFEKATVEHQRFRLRSYTRNWGVPTDLPIFAEAPFAATLSPFMFSVEERLLDWPEFYIGYDIRAPGFSGSKMITIVNQPRGRLWISDDASSEPLLLTRAS